MAAKSGGDKITRYIVIGMVVFVVGVGVVFSLLASKSTNSATVPSSVSAKDGYGIVFNGDVTGVPVVDIWEDFQCPVCGKFEYLNGAHIQEIIKEKKAKVVFHVLSFIGPESILAANASACAADEGKFLQLHEYLYKMQSEKENTGIWVSDSLIKAGASVGLNSSAFKDCVNNTKYLDWVQNVAAAAAKRNINSTPTVFVNDKPINRDTDYFDAAAFSKAVQG